MNYLDLKDRSSRHRISRVIGLTIPERNALGPGAFTPAILTNAVSFKAKENAKATDCKDKIGRYSSAKLVNRNEHFFLKLFN